MYNLILIILIYTVYQLCILVSYDFFLRYVIIIIKFCKPLGNFLTFWAKHKIYQQAIILKIQDKVSQI